AAAFPAGASERSSDSPLPPLSTLHPVLGLLSGNRPQLIDSSSERCGIRLCLVHPSAAQTALVGQASACQSEQSSDSSSSAPPRQWHSARFPSPFHHDAVVA